MRCLIYPSSPSCGISSVSAFCCVYALFVGCHLQPLSWGESQLAFVHFVSGTDSDEALTEVAFLVYCRTTPLTGFGEALRFEDFTSLYQAQSLASSLSCVIFCAYCFSSVKCDLCVLYTMSFQPLLYCLCHRYV